jgi:CubicO group peptidase (beta-lactamase class C family)
MFRIGSVSKLFIWTAVMRLVEQGKIDLDEDVNTYLADSDINVPATFDQPITMKDLMCHTPGFEDYVIGLFGRDEQSLKPIAELMKEQMPRRVRPPGDLAAYSNHGTLLAGVIIEQVSGMSWEDFVREQILSPLEMVNTSLDQPPKDQLPKTLSQAYRYDSAANEFEAEDFEYVPAAPAGCISASADDMGHFMIAHVNGGQYKTKQLLKPETVSLMHSRARWHDDRLDAMCHGFWELNRNGVRILEHGGDTQLFHSLMTIIPDEKVGLFVSYNTDTGGRLRDELRNAFLDRYFPVEKVKHEPPAGFSDRGNRFAGAYKMLRYDHSTLAKLNMVVQVLPVTVRDDDRLSIGGKSYVEVEPLQFEEENGPETVVFREAGTGEITHMFINRAPALALEKMQWYEAPQLHTGLLVASMLMFLSAIIGWPLVHLVTKGELIAGEPPTRMSRLASWFGWLAAVGFVGFTIVLVLQAEEIVHGMPPILALLLQATPVLAVIAVLLVLLSGLSWIRRYWRLTGRVHYFLLALAAVAAVWQLAFFNMLKIGV